MLPVFLGNHDYSRICHYFLTFLWGKIMEVKITSKITTLLIFCIQHRLEFLILCLCLLYFDIL